VGAVVWWWFPGRNLHMLRTGSPPGPWAAWERQEDEWRSRGLERRIENRYVALEEISVELQLAVLVSEDIEYFDHGAVDWTAVGEAIDEWRGGRRLRGASTISQQLVKSLYLSNERSAWRKLRQVRLASRLEDELSKKRIFELYLNVVEFGPGLLGAEAAATHYYERAALCLDPEQAAGLAAALPSPGRDNPDTITDLWKLRRELIMRRMTAAGWLRHKLEALNGYAIPDAG
jgi:monofunctional biosynthetic peptidoglycan transglycosylase